ncbi:ABC transporter substrate-binding protein [Kribbella sp. NPDC056345]|uniref:ABC transporter substrate-binding protein n=1 Tax=Kribbella sp. NPDC056345 TaxID=3345789 RepID=UPI0035E1B88B
MLKPGLLLVGLALVAGCSSTPSSGAEPSGSPITVQSCGQDLQLKAPARRIFVVDNDPVANLEALGAVDRVVGATSRLDPGLYEQSTYQFFEKLGTTVAEKNATGGSVVSQESILATEPDLVIAADVTVDRPALEAAGVPVYIPAAYCGTRGAKLAGRATFDRVWDELRTYGRMLGTETQAEQTIKAATGKITGLKPPARGTAAAIYVSSGGKVLSPYGGPSMVTPIFESVGLSNVYADVDKRVFDVSSEDLVSRNPQTIVLLYSGDKPQETLKAFTSATGVAGLAAVREKRVITLPFPYTDPPSALTTRAPEQLTRLLTGLE